MQVQQNVSFFFFFFVVFVFPRITALKMSADVYNSLVFCVSTEADGPLQLKCHYRQNELEDNRELCSSSCCAVLSGRGKCAFNSS